MGKLSHREEHGDEQNKSFLSTLWVLASEQDTFFDSDTLSTELQSNVEMALSKQASLDKQIHQIAVSEHCLFVIRLEMEGNILFVLNKATFYLQEYKTSNIFYFWVSLGVKRIAF